MQSSSQYASKSLFHFLNNSVVKDFVFHSQDRHTHTSSLAFPHTRTWKKPWSHLTGAYFHLFPLNYSRPIKISCHKHVCTLALVNMCESDLCWCSVRPSGLRHTNAQANTSSGEHTSLTIISQTFPACYLYSPNAPRHVLYSELCVSAVAEPLQEGYPSSTFLSASLAFYF